jgi:hypothetical protein
MSIQRVTILGGHTGPNTAYLVDDYPYGYTLRCQIRYWVETATKGAAKGQQRFVSQTTNPKRPGEPWNKSKASTYTSLVVMYLDDVEHVKSFHVSYHISPVGDTRFRLMGLYDQLDESTRAKYDQLLRIAQRYPDPWDDFEATVSALAAHIDRHGDTPKLDGAVWTDDNGRRHYVGDNPDVYLTLARQQAEKTA